MKANHGRTKQHGLIRLSRTVRMQLDETPVWAGRNRDVRAQPQVEALRRRRLVALNTRVFHAWQHAELPMVPVQKKRSLDQQKRLRRNSATSHIYAPIVGLRTQWVVSRVIDAVDLAGLRR